MTDDSRLQTTPGATDPLAEVEAGTPTGPSRSDLEALKDGAAMMIQAGNRVAAMALLWSAVAIDPTDLVAACRPRRMTGGDIDGAAEEYARYIEFMLPLGEVGRATLELSYGASVIGGHRALHEAAEKIVTAVRSIVPPAGLAVVPPVSAAIAPSIDVRPMPGTPAMRAPIAPTAATVETGPTPHAASLRGASASAACRRRASRDADRRRHDTLVPAGGASCPEANVIEARLCIPLAPGDRGHAPIGEGQAPAVAWVVIGVTNEVVALLDAGKPSPYGLQAKVGDEWLSLDLVDTGCRLGRKHAKTAAS